MYVLIRENKIAENMRNMPKMVEEYHAKMRAMRKAIREKKAADEEKIYAIATGKSVEKPEWLKYADQKKKKKELKK